MDQPLLRKKVSSMPKTKDNIIRRIPNYIPKNKLEHMVSSIWMWKIQYGQQLTHKVRLSEEDRNTKDLKATKIAQNTVLRLLEGSRAKDRRSI